MCQRSSSFWFARVEVLKEAAVASMVRHFTVKELNALATFYGSEEGQSAMTKFGAYMGDVMPIVQAEMRRAIEEAKAETAAKSAAHGT